MAAVESAVKHMHKLGMAHNDINPYNIMVREVKKGEGKLEIALIDFDSAARFGEETLKGGTQEWSADVMEERRSRPEHDLKMLVKLRKYLAANGEVVEEDSEEEGEDEGG